MAAGDPEQDFLADGSAMGALMRAHNWSSTPLGLPGSWPQSLRTSVSTCLNCAFPILIWWGPDLVKLYNDAYAPILGSKHPMALGTPGRIVWPEIWDVIAPMLGRVLQQGEATRAEDLLLLLRRHDYEEECYFSFSYSPIRDETGGVGGVFCPVVETTDRVTGERRLRLLRAIAERATDITTPEQACAAALACLRDSGGQDFPFSAIYLTDEADDLARLIGTDGIPACAETLSLDRPEGTSLLAMALGTTDTVMLDNPASVFGGLPSGPWATPPQQVVLLPLQTGASRPAGFILAGLNPHRPVPEMRSFAELVASQVANAVVKARSYQQERRRAEALLELDRTKTAFFSNVSHEFRTPLTLMLGPLREAQTKPDDTPVSQVLPLLDVATRNALRLQRLVNVLLDFSRIESGRIRARYRPTDLAHLTAELASSFRSVMAKADLDLVVSCPKLSQPVYVDPEMWEKIVLNLLSNALKFTLAGRVSVDLSEQDEAVILTVRDTGIGISAAELPHVFERFHRVEGARGRSHEGTGIGLALVSDLVRLHNGIVSVESVPGQGSVFCVTLKLGQSHLPAELVSQDAGDWIQTGLGVAFLEEASTWTSANEIESAALLDQHATTTGDAATILLAEDNSDMRAYVARLLMSAGYNVVVARDGQDALAKLPAVKPDLVLSDVMMPNLDGLELVQAIRADAEFQELPVILLSARAGEEAQIAGMASTADDYLIKPFSARELIARIKANLATARIRQQARHALLDLNKTLEQRIQERTAERDLMESELRQMQRLDAIGQLTSGVAHDFNNLLAIVLGTIELIERDPKRLTSRRIAMMRSAAERGAKLTAQLLAFARKQHLSPQAIDLNEAVIGMNDLLRGSLGGTVQLEIALQPELWPALVDQAQLELVILNLAINARDAMPVGGRLTIETKTASIVKPGGPHDPPPGDYVEVSVSDTGTGMPPNVLERAFEPFFTTKELGKGSGLGLAQVYGFAKQSGGGVRIDTRVNEGTSIKVYFPRADRLPAHVAEPTGLTVVAETAKPRLLLVDDDNDVREITQAVLEDNGYSVMAVASGAAALEQLDHDPSYDVLLLDYAMPGMNGLELLRRIEARLPELPAVIMTGFADSSALAELGERPLILKPFRPEQLMTALRQATREKRPVAVPPLRLVR